jgi:putative nucleotidyltransferase with HDIG domain
MDEKIKILFVDDEINVLEGLQRMLRSQRGEWDLSFARGGREALEMMVKNRFDVVVSDMRMPEIDGVALLTAAQRHFPQMVRFILSGYSEKTTLLRSVGSTHQFLSKPCDSEVLKSAVNRAMRLRNLMNDGSMKKLVSQIGALPSLPEIYVELEEEIKSPSCSLKKVANIIEKDVSMCAKILQIVNSAFFGLRRTVSNPAQAAILLGIDTLQSLVFMAQVFSTVEESAIKAFSLKSLWEHSLQVSTLAKKIVMAGKLGTAIEDEACKAGLFHDLGKLVIAMNMPDVYLKVVKYAAEKKVNISGAEKRILGIDHGKVGAYLLGLWGFTDPILEAVAFHHEPELIEAVDLNMVTVVHVADSLDHENCYYHALPAGQSLNDEYLMKMHFESRLIEWRRLCMQRRSVFECSLP